LLGTAFLAGFLAHFFYHRWNTSVPQGGGYAVTFAPLPPPAGKTYPIPLVEAREVEKIKALAGTRAKIRGRVFRVGHSAKSDTYFLSFGPSSASFTGVIFASAVARFQQKQLNPKGYEGKEVELVGEIKDHPQYGLEMILEDPNQIRLLD
jgi:hypothetical protein